MAAEHIDSLDLLGLKLIDLHLMLELVLSSSYFTFAGRLYQQLIGLFMGCKPSPICAVVRVYTFVKRIIYVDPHYLTLPYGRYIDEAFTITDDKELAVSSTAYQHRIPMVESGGKLNSRYQTVRLCLSLEHR